MNWLIVYGIGFGVVFLITVLRALSAMGDKDLVKGVCFIGFITAIFWPLLIFGLLLSSVCLLALYLLSFICQVIYK